MIKFEIVSIESTASTNAMMHQMYLEGKCFNGLVLKTDYQTHGKGLQSNTWFSRPSTNLLFSIGLETRFIEPSRQFLLTKMISIALLRSLQKLLLLNEGLSIKWPNDLYYKNQKLAGILVNNMIKGNSLDYSIIGVGLNVNETYFPAHLPNPVSMVQIGNQIYERDKVLDVILLQLSQSIEMLQSDATSLDEPYLKHLLYYQQWHEYQFEGNDVTGKIEGVNKYGHLQVLTYGGELLSCDLKDLVLKH